MLLLLNIGQVLRIAKLEIAKLVRRQNYFRSITYALRGRLLHLDLASLVEGGEDLESLLVIALLAQARRHLDLLLHLLVVVHDEDCHDALSLNRLTIWAITSAIDDDLGLHGGDHGLLHQHGARLLDSSVRVHRNHALRLVTLPVHKQLLLVIGALVIRVLVVSLVGTVWLAIDDSRLAKDLWVAHLARHGHLLDDSAVHGLGLVVRRHRDLLLRAHIWLLLLVLVDLLAATAILVTALVGRGLAKFEHAVGVRAVVLVGASLTSAEVFADHCLMVLEVLTAL